MAILAQSEACRGGLLLPWRTFLLASLALASYLFLGAAPKAWIFDRTAVAQGEWWRLITGHWMHSDGTHAFWNIGALILLGTLLEKQLQGRLVLALVIGTLGVNLWLWWGDGTLRYYCGLSGILNSLLAVGLVQLWYDLRQPLVWLIGLGAIAKIMVEISAGQALLTETAWPSVPEAHAAGFLSGLLVGYVIKSTMLLRKKCEDLYPI
jgi:rhomboid family GlyGly-CTERM serine protease